MKKLSISLLAAAALVSVSAVADAVIMVYPGWNLAGNSSDSPVTVNGSSVQSVWSYDSGNWTEGKDQTVPPNKGFWIQSDPSVGSTVIVLSNQGESTGLTEDFGPLQAGWNLLALPKDAVGTKVSDLNATKVWAYYAQAQVWAEDIESVNPDQGFWAKLASDYFPSDNGDPGMDDNDTDNSVGIDDDLMNPPSDNNTTDPSDDNTTDPGDGDTNTTDPIPAGSYYNYPTGNTQVFTAYTGADKTNCVTWSSPGYAVTIVSVYEEVGDLLVTDDRLIVSDTDGVDATLCVSYGADILSAPYTGVSYVAFYPQGEFQAGVSTLQSADFVSVLNWE